MNGVGPWLALNLRTLRVVPGSVWVSTCWKVSGCCCCGGAALILLCGLGGWEGGWVGMMRTKKKAAIASPKPFVDAGVVLCFSFLRAGLTHRGAFVFSGQARGK